MYHSWLPVPFAPGFEVSDLGFVRGPNGILSPWLDSSKGYPMVELRHGVNKRFRVHNLVAPVFLGPRPEGMSCRHINDVKTDNRVENLAWGTHAENMRDVVLNGRHERSHVSHCPRGHPLFPWNVPPSALARGSRQCLACNRVIGRADNLRPGDPGFQERADIKFAELKAQFGGR